LLLFSKRSAFFLSMRQPQGNLVQDVTPEAYSIFPHAAFNEKCPEMIDWHLRYPALLRSLTGADGPGARDQRQPPLIR
jgi:hypothetical protein